MGAFLCWMAVRVLEMHRVLKDTGSIYLHCDHTASHYLKAMMDAIFGRQNFRNEIVWGYNKPRPASKKFVANHDVILFYAKSDQAGFNPQRVPTLDGKFELRKPVKRPDGSVWTPKEPGKLAGSWWYDIPSFATRMTAKERTGYPTQKPLALYKRIIAASSNPGDIVLDPFAGCATTCVAAEQLGRQWIGVDIEEDAGPVILDRLRNEVKESMAWDKIVRLLTDAPERTDDGEPVAPELVVTSQKKNAPKIPVSEARKQLVVRDGMRCQGCGWVPPYADHLQVDHKRPKSRKGKDEMPNFTLLCGPCNGKKSNKMTLTELRKARVEEERMDAEWWEEKQWE